MIWWVYRGNCAFYVQNAIAINAALPVAPLRNRETHPISSSLNPRQCVSDLRVNKQDTCHLTGFDDRRFESSTPNSKCCLWHQSC